MPAEQLKLAAILPFHGRPQSAFPLMTDLLMRSSRIPDEVWVVCENDVDVDTIRGALDEIEELCEPPLRWARPLKLRMLPTPVDHRADRYLEIPYSRKINLALDSTDCDLIVYVDNGSRFAPEKFERMARHLEENPEHGACYCSQHRTGYRDELSIAGAVVEDAYCVLNFTQVMHRLTDDRWTTDMRWANPDLADALFWRSLHQSLGAFHPIAHEGVLDWHHMPSPAAQGI